MPEINSLMGAIIEALNEGESLRFLKNPMLWYPEHPDASIISVSLYRSKKNDVPACSTTANLDISSIRSMQPGEDDSCVANIVLILLSKLSEAIEMQENRGEPQDV